MLKPHVPDVERCNLLVEKLVDFIEEDRELEVEKARDEGYSEGYSEGGEAERLVFQELA
jgi:flagellar biosynthesis/type III secretory pathway protein FliH